MSLVTLMDLAIKRIIRMAMKITPFVNMCQEDQIALLKGGCTELMVLKSVQQYDSEKNSWRVSSEGLFNLNTESLNLLFPLDCILMRRDINTLPSPHPS